MSEHQVKLLEILDYTILGSFFLISLGILIIVSWCIYIMWAWYKEKRTKNV